MATMACHNKTSRKSRDTPTQAIDFTQPRTLESSKSPPEVSNLGYKYAFRWTRLSCKRFRDNEVRLQGTSIFSVFSATPRCERLKLARELLIGGLVGGFVSVVRPSGRDPWRFAA